MRSAVQRFAIGAAVTLAVLVLISILIARIVARQATLDEASFRTTTIADSLAAPLVTQSFRHHDADAVADMSRLMGNRMSDTTIRHIKIWSADGTILWADEPGLIGRHYTLKPDQREALDSPDAISDYTDLSDPENISERNEKGPVIETYVGANGADGSRILFETYMSPEGAARQQDAIVRATVLVGLAALLVFGVAVLPAQPAAGATGRRRPHGTRADDPARAAVLGAGASPDRPGPARRRDPGPRGHRAGPAAGGRPGQGESCVARGRRPPQPAPRPGHPQRAAAAVADGRGLPTRPDRAPGCARRSRTWCSRPRTRWTPRCTSTRSCASARVRPGWPTGSSARACATSSSTRTPARALVEIRREDGWVHVVVADDGRGVTADAGRPGREEDATRRAPVRRGAPRAPAAAATPSVTRTGTWSWCPTGRRARGCGRGSSRTSPGF